MPLVKFKYAISTKSDGNMSFMWGSHELVLENRRRFLEKAGFDFDKCVTMLTSDSNEVKVVDSQSMGRGMLRIDDVFTADALITTEEELNLFLLVADCVATIFYDDVNKVLCLAHLNGMNPGLISAVISKMRDKYSVDPSKLQVFMGPAIKKESFIVPDSFQKEDPKWQNYIINLDEHLTSIDMVGFLRDEMVRNGVNLSNISISDNDSYKELDLFSHRRSVVTGEAEGRFALVVKMTK